MELRVKTRGNEQSMELMVRTRGNEKSMELRVKTRGNGQNMELRVCLGVSVELSVGIGVRERGRSYG